MVYIDTSALAKWYLPERRSEDFVTWMQAQADTWISTLTMAEMVSLLNRRQRDLELSEEEVARVLGAVDADVGAGFLLVHPIEDRIVRGARFLLTEMVELPLQTLDAIHLAAIRDLDVSGVATADRVLAMAAVAMGLDVTRFD